MHTNVVIVTMSVTVYKNTVDHLVVNTIHQWAQLHLFGKQKWLHQKQRPPTTTIGSGCGHHTHTPVDAQQTGWQNCSKKSTAVFMHSTRLKTTILVFLHWAKRNNSIWKIPDSRGIHICKAFRGYLFSMRVDVNNSTRREFNYANAHACEMTIANWSEIVEIMWSFGYRVVYVNAHLLCVCMYAFVWAREKERERESYGWLWPQADGWATSGRLSLFHSLSLSTCCVFPSRNITTQYPHEHVVSLHIKWLLAVLLSSEYWMWGLCGVQKDFHVMIRANEHITLSRQQNLCNTKFPSIFFIQHIQTQEVWNRPSSLYTPAL